jgi:ribosomal protein S27AE
MDIDFLKDIEFDGEFEEETDICSNCGADIVLTGWNEEKDLSRFECAECGVVLIYDSDYKETMVKGQKRDWLKFLSEELTFPFEARIDEVQEGGLFRGTGSLRYNDKVVVIKLSGYSGWHGIVAKIKKGRKTYRFPLCDLAIDDEKNPSYRVLDNYRTWFANCR